MLRIGGSPEDQLFFARKERFNPRSWYICNYDVRGEAKVLGTCPALHTPDNDCLSGMWRNRLSLFLRLCRFILAMLDSD
jgi:hypothetical protein